MREDPVPAPVSWATSAPTSGEATTFVNRLKPADSLLARLLSALRPAPRLTCQALKLSIPVTATLIAFPGLAARIWRVLLDGGRPAAILLVVTACAIGIIALKIAPAPGEPDVHDRQLDVILAVPFVGLCLGLASGWPEHFRTDHPLTGHQILAATALLTGSCLLMVGTRLTARLRWVLLLPLFAMPQITGRPILLELLVLVTFDVISLLAIARYRRRGQIAASDTSAIANDSTGHRLLPRATSGTKLGPPMQLPALKENDIARDDAQLVGGSASQVQPSQVETVSARFIETTVSR